jgi:O-succinylbenzoate synthase
VASTNWPPSAAGLTCASLLMSPSAAPKTPLRVAEAAGLPCVVSSALETSVGLAAQLALAGALPELDFACGLGALSLLEGDVVSAGVRPRRSAIP